MKRSISRTALVCYVTLGLVYASVGKSAAPSDADAIKAVEQEYAAAVSAGDAGRLMNTMTEDAVVMPPGAPMVVGASAIRTYVNKNFFDLYTMQLNLVYTELKVSGDCAYAYGTYTRSDKPRAGGAATTEKGKMLSVFQRQSNGAWKYARLMHNTDAP